MKILGFKKYLDGGTVEVKTEFLTFCFDYRMRREYKGKIFIGYPKDDNSNLVLDDKDLKKRNFGKFKTIL